MARKRRLVEAAAGKNCQDRCSVISITYIFQHETSCHGQAIFAFKKWYMKHRRIFFNTVACTVALSTFAFLSSCKKHKDAQPSGGNDSPVSVRSDEDSLKYLMYRIMQVNFVDGGRDSSFDLPTYYWYDQVPKMDPFSAAYNTADDLLEAMKAYPMNPQTSAAIDRYSFLDRTGSVANEIQNGIVDGVFSGTESNGNLGLEASYALDQNNKSHLFVLYADKNSPAGVKGIQRGWEITAVNNDTAISYDGSTGANVNRVSHAIYESAQTTITFRKTDNTTVTYTLDAAQYNLNPILFDSIYVKNNKKIGYFVLYTFSSVYDDNGAGTPTKQVLDDEFTKLKSAGINDLIVDLRYNGGGAVSTAEYLDSAIAPASANGKVMYSYLYNDKLTKNRSLLGLDSKVNFSGTGGLNLDHVFFITTRSTASASELTLNNLKPYMDVKQVGDTSFGKPVGFIDFTVSDYDSTGKENYLADLFAINYATENAAGVGGYFQGIPPDVAADDFVNVPWGDRSDDNLDKIFNYISTGSFNRTAALGRTAMLPDKRMTMPTSIRPRSFNGMVDYRLSRQMTEALKKQGLLH